MSQHTFSARYTAAMAESGGRCLIEAGVLGRLADHECRQADFLRTEPRRAGAGPGEGAVVVALTRPAERRTVKRRAA